MLSELFWASPVAAQSTDWGFASLLCLWRRCLFYSVWQQSAGLQLAVYCSKVCLSAVEQDSRNPDTLSYCHDGATEEWSQHCLVGDNPAVVLGPAKEDS